MNQHPNTLYPLVSVIIPCYNVELFIRRSLDSILRQSYPYFEVICIDDCSSDTTLNILRDYEANDNRIKVFRNKENLGVTKTRNLLLNYAGNDLIMNMDADDISDQYRLEKLVDRQLKTNADIVSSSYILINEKDQPLPTKGLKLLTTKMGIKYITLFNSPIPHAPILFKKDLLQGLQYNPEYKAAEDYKLFADLYKTRNVHAEIILEPLYLYRINTNGMSISNGIIQAENHIKIAKEFLIEEFENVDESKYNFWELTKDRTYIQNKTIKNIVSSLNQIDEVRNLYLKKYNIKGFELEEINEYTAQYYLFTCYSILKNNIKRGSFVVVITAFLISVLQNLSLLFNIKNIKWILKNM